MKPFYAMDRWNKIHAIIYLADEDVINEWFRVNRINNDTIRIQWISGKSVAKFTTIQTEKPNPFTEFDKKRTFQVRGLVNAMGYKENGTKIPLIKGQWELAT